MKNKKDIQFHLDSKKNRLKYNNTQFLNQLVQISRNTFMTPFDCSIATSSDLRESSIQILHADLKCPKGMHGRGSILL